MSSPIPPKMSSKKFVAYLIAESTWKAVLILWLVMITMFEHEPKLWEYVVMLVVVVTAGFLEVGYILGVSSLDKYTRLAQIAVEAGTKTNGTANRILAKGTKGLVQVDDPSQEGEEPDPNLKGDEEEDEA